MKVTVEKVPPGNMIIQIEGKIAGRQVAELERAWQEAELTLGNSKLSLDIRGVTYLDEGARQLLAGIFAKTRAEFIADTPLTKYFAAQAQQSVPTDDGIEFETHSQPKVRKQS